VDVSDYSTLYITSFYFGFSLLATLGLGDIVAFSNAEKLFAVGCMLLGVSFYSFIISKLSIAFANLESEESKLHKKSELLETFIRDHKLPEHLAQKLRQQLLKRSAQPELVATDDDKTARRPEDGLTGGSDWVDGGFAGRDGMRADGDAASLLGDGVGRDSLTDASPLTGLSNSDKDELMSHLSSKLRCEVNIFLHANTIEKIPFLHDKDIRFVSAVISSLQGFRVMAGDYIVHEGFVSQRVPTASRLLLFFFPLFLFPFSVSESALTDREPVFPPVHPKQRICR
jgi:hypothetical protein